MQDNSCSSILETTNFWTEWASLQWAKVDKKKKEKHVLFNQAKSDFWNGCCGCNLECPR
jgi:thiamine kinase-like enzyme